ncbi:hypothetical protein phiOC_p400 [Ochrobactrum phage vB_OspM_OC]|nr:hypothetical protein phiOC_p400 [Ochrobactrum phage vB_OspM_OC]
MLKEDIVTTDSSAGLNDGVRYKRSKFANATVFDVDFNLVMRPELVKHPRHRYSRYFIDENLSNEIRGFAKDNPKETIVLRCIKSGRMVYFKKPQGGG